MAPTSRSSSPRLHSHSSGRRRPSPPCHLRGASSLDGTWDGAHRFVITVPLIHHAAALLLATASPCRLGMPGPVISEDRPLAGRVGGRLSRRASNDLAI